MALVLADRVNETTTTAGLGTLTLAGAVAGYQSFSVIGNANTTYYTIVGQTTGEWEVGIGTYTSAGTTLSRDTVLSSSAGGTTKVTLSAGTKFVFCDYPAGKAIYQDASGNTYAPNLGATTASTGTFTTLIASLDSQFTSTGALLISKGTTGQQPGSPATGMLRYNTTTSQFEGYSGASPAWTSVGGASIVNDTSSATAYYPLFAYATSGTALNIYTSNAKYLYTPSTGELVAPEVVVSNGIHVNSATVNSSYTIASGYNGFSVGPMTIASGAVVTVSTGQIWTVI